MLNPCSQQGQGLASIFSLKVILFSKVFFLFLQGDILHKIHFYFFPSQFFPARKGKKWKNIFRTLYFIHIFPPPIFFYFFFTKEGRKMFSVLLIFTFFPPSTQFLFPPTPFSRFKFAEYSPLSQISSRIEVFLIYMTKNTSPVKTKITDKRTKIVILNKNTLNFYPIIKMH